MDNLLTIVMYHYVRPIKGTKHPRIRGLELANFEAQLDYIEQYYSVVSMDKVLDAASGNSTLPTRPLLLTFDDGYLDHYEFVFPALLRRKLVGCFFPPVQAVREAKILDVNKIHYILDALVDPSPALDDIDRFIEDSQGTTGVLSTLAYRGEFMVSSRFDTAETMYIKRLLQFGLPESLRSVILDRLFAQYVSADEAGFASRLYVSEQQLREMVSAGMTVGGHGYSHRWLNRLSPTETAFEIDRSLEMLGSVGAPADRFVFCYPYGGYDAQTLSILKDRGCTAAFTTVVELANLNGNGLLELPRIDTNDLPISATAEPVSWTNLALQEKAH